MVQNKNRVDRWVKYIYLLEYTFFSKNMFHACFVDWECERQKKIEGRYFLSKNFLEVVYRKQTTFYA